MLWSLIPLELTVVCGVRKRDPKCFIHSCQLHWIYLWQNWSLLMKWPPHPSWSSLESFDPRLLDSQVHSLDPGVCPYAKTVMSWLALLYGEICKQEAESLQFHFVSKLFRLLWITCNSIWSLDPGIWRATEFYVGISCHLDDAVTNSYVQITESLKAN